MIEYCETLGIGFFSTGFDERSNAFLANVGLSQFKIPVWGDNRSSLSSPDWFIWQRCDPFHRHGVLG